MSSEIHKGPLEPVVAAAPVRKLSWREKRWERRRRRRIAEEALGWVLVPVITIGLFWAVKAGLNALGTSPTSIIQGVKTVLGQ